MENIFQIIIWITIIKSYNISDSKPNKKTSTYVFYSKIFHEPTVHIFKQHTMKQEVYKLIIGMLLITIPQTNN